MVQWIEEDGYNKTIICESMSNINYNSRVDTVKWQYTNKV